MGKKQDKLPYNGEGIATTDYEKQQPQGDKDGYPPNDSPLRRHAVTQQPQPAKGPMSEFMPGGCYAEQPVSEPPFSVPDSASITARVLACRDELTALKRLSRLVRAAEDAAKKRRRTACGPKGDAASETYRLKPLVWNKYNDGYTFGNAVATLMVNTDHEGRWAWWASACRSSATAVLAESEAEAKAAAEAWYRSKLLEALEEAK